MGELLHPSCRLMHTYLHIHMQRYLLAWFCCITCSEGILPGVALCEIHLEFTELGVGGLVGWVIACFCDGDPR